MDYTMIVQDAASSSIITNFCIHGYNLDHACKALCSLTNDADHYDTLQN